ncbi:MAG: CoA ester lyase [Gammaproteobacteria bacterium]|nr:CoA ester lyase [Gammaproteobacteria bacterium]
MTPADSARPRRSVLYVPGSNARAIAKAAALPVDAVILDLEDSVLPAAKPAARAAVLSAVRARHFGYREVVVRANSLSSEWGLADLKAVAGSGVDGILLTKIDDAEAVHETIRVLEQSEAPVGLRLWCMAETPRGVLDIDAIARSCPRLAVIVMGTADLGKALRIPEHPDRMALVPALARCVLAARAAGLDILDGVYTHLTDTAGFRQECVQGKQLGFDGKTLIHPDQIDASNEIFGISASDAAAAVELIGTWESAAAGGAGVAVLAGRMVERLHVEEARRQLALYRLIQDQALSAGQA